MDSRGHRAIRALAVFLVLALGVAALLPLIARGAFQVNGVISTCGGPTPFVSGTVTLIDANGINPPQTTTSSQFSGVYAFTPPTGSYTISVTASGYYPASNSTPVRFDGSRSVRIDACLFRYGTPSKVLGVTVLHGGLPVAGACRSKKLPLTTAGMSRYALEFGAEGSYSHATTPEERNAPDESCT